MTLTLQDIFDRIWQRAKDKRRAAVQWPAHAGSDCRYRTVLNDGSTLACFIGACIQDERYRPDMEGLSPWAVLDRDPLAFGAPCSADPHLLRDLQAIHDSEPPEEWEFELRGFARIHNLQVPDDAREGGAR